MNKKKTHFEYIPRDGLKKMIVAAFISAFLISCIFIFNDPRNKNKECEEWVGEKMEKFIYNRKWIPAHEPRPQVYQGVNLGPNYKGMYIILDSLNDGWLDGEIYSFRCDRSDTTAPCYSDGSSEGFTASVDSPYVWTIPGGFVIPTEVRDVTLATENRLAWKKRGGTCTENFKLTQQIFLDTLGDTVRVFD